MKKFYFVLLLLITIILLCGCTQLPSALSIDENGNYVFSNKYIIIEKQQFNDYKHMCLAYDKDTKVMYDISFDTYYVNICPHYINGTTVGVYEEK